MLRGIKSNRWARSSASRESIRPAVPLVRELESRRVLNAAVAGFIAPDTMIEGQFESIIADAEGVGRLAFDWSVALDGQVVQQSNNRELPFQPTDNGNYVITVQVTDRSGAAPAVATTSITVLNATPLLTNLSATPTDEGGESVLTGRVVDPGAADTFALTVDWGDGVTETLPIDADARDFSFRHRYRDNVPGDPTGPITINLSVEDDDGGVSFASTSAVVTNASPTLADLNLTSVNEGDQAVLSGRIDDPGQDDTFSLLVDWGDGVTETVNLPAGERDFSLAHRYLDDDPSLTTADRYLVSVTVRDNDGGASQETIKTTVFNVAPQLADLAATDSDEGGATTLTGQIIDQGVRDTFTLLVNWGDGTIESVSLAADQRSFTLDHVYRDDDPNGTASDRSTITVTLTDDDRGSVTQTVRPTVFNVAPLIRDLVATNTSEGGATTLTGRIVDPGVRDTFTLLVNWGDGSVETVSLAADQRSFTLDHVYVDDDPTGTSSDRPTITVTLTDDDRGSFTQSVRPTVFNVPPLIAPLSDRVINEGDQVVLGEQGGVLFSDPGLRDTHLATIDWGDGSAPETLAVSFIAGMGQIDGSHTYADNGLYTATIILTDDDTGSTQASFRVQVNNVDPVLIGVADLMIEEGAAVDLATLGVRVSDPGFDNPLNTDDPTNGGETSETFRDGVIDWGDGSPTTAVRFLVTTTGSAGVPTIATPEHDPHYYADNGDYTVSVRFSDDDGSTIEQRFSIAVTNVAPTLTLRDPGVVIDEGTLLQLPDLGRFFDPGFDNPLRPGGASTEDFTITIDWGDGLSDTFRPADPAYRFMPTGVVQGGPAVATTGVFSAEHFYADNDTDGIRDNRYTITVTLSDDDGGIDTQSFLITVNNVAPTLDPITATDLGGDGITTLNLSFADPGADTFEVLVDWGDRLNLPAADRFVVERLYAGPTPQSFTINHRYFGPPNPQNPAADIVISVLIRDDDFGSAALAVGQSNLEVVAISNSGVEDNKVAIDTTPQAPEIKFPEAIENVAAVERSTAPPSDRSATADGAASADAGIGAERYLELRLVGPDGVEGAGYRLPDDSLSDLPTLFSRLPDDRYRIYVVEAQTETRRLVIDVNVRGGRVVDLSDDSDGGRDRPPTTRLRGEAADDAPADPPAEPTPAVEEAAAGPAAAWVPELGMSNASASGPASRAEQGPKADQDSPTADTRSETGTAAAATLLLARLAKAQRIERATAGVDLARWHRLIRRRPH
ncbi:PKD domain-containing protein [Botrimarina hoheduenensis]|uniref:PKD domain-containing protein n=1 Tax=Botrimarina hoheduenensis TaxID=2528000 RepID=A0A5C5VXK8_9BACT|nr:PKD domain-containing protein [Botrimarina hoheduenensis]TWT43356.1 hypothetical protein Pla111_23070 [Botrimarina hoheduenensis]